VQGQNISLELVSREAEKDGPAGQLVLRLGQLDLHMAHSGQHVPDYSCSKCLLSRQAGKAGGTRIVPAPPVKSRVCVEQGCDYSAGMRLFKGGQGMTPW